MCIPYEYFLDGYRDCMHSTDEQNIFDVEQSGQCPFLFNAFKCDKTLFRRMYFSCGDGQFMYETDRMDQVNSKSCTNFRNRKDGFV
ncbi:unnamed protein product [Didymodactylos carnosus]|uniref:Uncharacterized protein n=1 Tax=Didymodactylos carnosus TaxID=1234261 RepID=A0A815A9T9_9BILA|nr:unnamed protein product [Didymodactylos carnosus]CAF1325242.1 unnamed protein product [Didymodactylos carnosus]CAF4029973.1 unnamed protein product [Didymodactylos carnosus]CAF4136181.1 unnamed protein product [Didymodactylos carnosus]